MNIIGLVFSILLIIGYGYYASFDQHKGSLQINQKLRSSNQAMRKIQNSYANRTFQNLPGKSTKEKKKQSANNSSNQSLSPKPNRECAKINLWPIVQEGKIQHPLLYEKIAELIRTFYPALAQREKGFEYYFLDILIKTIKKECTTNQQIHLEKLEIIDAELQMPYYQMLKGTKTWDLKKKIGTPPLLDYLKAIDSKDRICLQHAHPDLMTILFNQKMAENLYKKLHKKDGPPPTRQLIETIASEEHLIFIDQKIFDLLLFEKHRSTEKKKVFQEKDNSGNVIIRQNIPIK